MKTKLLNFLWYEPKKKKWYFFMWLQDLKIFIEYFFIEKVPLVLKQKMTTFLMKTLGPSILLKTNSL